MALAGSALIGCKGALPSLGGSAGPVITYPDYKEVTIPANIAPLNYRYAMDGARKAVTTFSIDGKEVKIKGLDVTWKLKAWKKFVAEAAGKTIEVKTRVNVNGQDIEDSWSIFVSEDSIDPYLTYRLIEPAFQMWNEVIIQERCIENFEVSSICDHQHTDNSCMNCHIHGQQRGDLSMFYIRGPKGGAILNRDGKLRKLNLKSDGMLSGTVYGDIHPSGRFGVFSTNIIIPGLHSASGGRTEVYDTASDLTVADFDRNVMINEAHVARADAFETFPCFSADGNTVYYCVADTVSIPKDIENLKYHLVGADFDASTGRISEKMDTLYNANEHNASVCHPKASPDGRWLMFSVADYGTFPINHDEAGLQMIDLRSGEINTLDAIKGDRSDTYHSWSSDSRWFVFASKRGDGQYSKAYFCHIDENGNPSKPFLLPQKSTRFYDNNLKSFNVTDLGKASVGISVKDSKRMYDSESEVFTSAD